MREKERRGERLREKERKRGREKERKREDRLTESVPHTDTQTHTHNRLTPCLIARWQTEHGLTSSDNGNAVNDDATTTTATSSSSSSRDGSPATAVKRTRYSTPFGARVVFEVTGGFTVTVHLKDPKKVRKGKRWSQVMYMYYLMRYEIDSVGRKNGVNTDNAYILATDADIKFGSQDVIALLMMIARDRGVGAVCGRTYPLGGGPLVWYQHFDYAIGHWFQKAAEHVLGTVLCCPGCFSMFRVDALRQVVLEYSTHVDKAFDFLTKDMGEDRWLCTLLVTRGWRLEYCAAAKDKTYCPDDLESFFKQRRRWIVSTMANMVEILRLGGLAVRRNPSVSWLYIVYTALMLVSTVVRSADIPFHSRLSSLSLDLNARSLPLSVTHTHIRSYIHSLTQSCILYNTAPPRCCS